MTLTRRDWLRAAITAAVSPSLLTILASRSTAAPKSEDIKTVVEKAIGFLRTVQNDDGSLAPKLGGPGITALVVSGSIRHGQTDNPLVTNGLKYLESNVQKDGGVYSRGLANYTTCLAVMTFQEAKRGGKYDKVIANAAAFVKGLQHSEDPKDVRFGGVGYDGKSRLDLSNTQFMVEALIASGVSRDDPAIKQALKFISRSQNLPGEYNDQPFAKKAFDDDKGGFVYNPQEQDNEKSAKRTAAGGLRSEGGMTYAGLKSFLYAGVGKDDPRVKAAIDWIRRHYTLSENPSMGRAGLFYYYHTFAKAMDALGEDSFVDAKGSNHDWSQELFDVLKAKQKSDGSWANENRAFLENQPELATAFAILALSYCTSPKD